MAETSSFPVTTFELVALLALAPSPASTQSAASLRLPDPAGDPVAKRAGLASLVVRDLATIDGGEIHTQGQAGAVAGVLTTATHWVEIGVVRRTSTDAAVLFGVAQGALMITPRGFDVWDVLAITAGTDLITAAIDLAARGIDVTPQGEPVAVTIKTTTPDGSITASTHRDEHGTWQTALEPRDATGQLTIQPDTTPDQTTALTRIAKALR